VHWSDNAPNHVCNQINNCTKKGRRISGLAFRDDHWYVSGVKDDGSGEHCWGNIPQKTSNAKVAIGSYDVYNGKLSYAVCHQYGGYDSDMLPSDLCDVMYKATTIRSLFLSGNNEYFIRYDGSWAWSSSNEHITEELEETRHGNSVCFISIFNDGSWIVCRENSFAVSVDFPRDLKSHICQHFSEQKKIKSAQIERINSYRGAIADFERNG